MRVVFVAAPLTARSGVYRSGRELVTAGRDQGQDWSLILGVSARAAGHAPADDPAWVDEFAFEPAGIGGVRALRTRLVSHPFLRDADMIVSLIPQTDMALSGMGRPWVAFLRGKPWPDRGEGPEWKRLIWKTLERRALRGAHEIWATTAILRDEVDLPGIALVPAGIRPLARTWDGRGERRRVVWAARYNADKNPALFLDALRGIDAEGVMHGSGPLEQELHDAAPENVEVAGWTTPEALWENALAYLGTSHREAFGRSALEAAMNGVPVVLADSFGVAPFLITDAELAERFVLPVGDVVRWRRAVEDLRTDEALRVAYSDHLVANAAGLTIDSSAKAVAQRLDTLR